jgi:5-methylcytosine-specific restriction endonuclease McrA
LPQAAAPFLTFHIEHIRARQHGGNDDLSNLALACPDCNAYKGPNLTSIDPETRQVVALFNPRQDIWSDHFSLEGPTILARTPTGRATVRLLSMNEPSRVEMRWRLQEAGAM